MASATRYGERLHSPCRERDGTALGFTLNPVPVCGAFHGILPRTSTGRAPPPPRGAGSLGVAGTAGAMARIASTRIIAVSMTPRHQRRRPRLYDRLVVPRHKTVYRLSGDDLRKFARVTGRIRITTTSRTCREGAD